MGGDVCHHPGMLRPSPFVPLPENLRASLPEALRDVGAPDYQQPFIDYPIPGCSIHHNDDDARKTVEAIRAFDAHPDIFVIIAHDRSMGDILPLFPEEATGWKAKGWKEKAFWAFLTESNASFRWPAPKRVSA
jgi:hypothetical protein